MGLRKARKRLAISEVMGSLIMIAITLIAGAAVFGFVNGASGSSAQAVGNSAAANANFLNEREVVVMVSLITPSGGCPPLPSGCTDANVYVYNNGAISPENITHVLVYPTNDAPEVCNFAPIGGTLINQYQIGVITVDLTQCSGLSSPPFYFVNSPSATYVFEAVGQYGSTSQLTVVFA